MNFDNLILNDLMTGLYQFIPALLISFFWHWQYSLHCVNQWVQEFKIHSVDTVSELSQKPNVKILTYVKWERNQKESNEQ